MTYNQPFYRVDPCMLPAAGLKTECPWQPSTTLAQAQETLHKFHVERQSKTLQKLGLASLRGPPGTPRGIASIGEPTSARSGTSAPSNATQSYPKAHIHAAALATARRLDPRLRGTAPARGPVPPGMDLLIDGLRRRLQSLGFGSHKILEKMFIEMDTDRSGVLCSAEFKKGLQSLGLCSSDGECDIIFAYFDEDRSGTIDFREFLGVVKGHLSDARRQVVREAFNSLDVTGDGILSVEDLQIKFHSHQVPDVRNGCSTEDKVYKEFLDTFDTMAKDGNVTISEFEQYYEYLSALIANDDLFAATVRNAWNLPGAMGGSCLRVKITRAGKTGRGLLDKTHQEMVEIRPDIGMSKQDPRFFSAVRERMIEMGYHDVEDIQVLNRY